MELSAIETAHAILEVLDKHPYEPGNDPVVAAECAVVLAAATARKELMPFRYLPMEG